MTSKNNNNFKIDGSVSEKKLLYDRRFPVNTESTEMIISCSPYDYSASAISRAVEDCNAHVLNLNLTGERTEKGFLIIDIRVDHRNGTHIARSLERYGFEVLDYGNSHDKNAEDTARQRAEEIIRILDI